MTDSKNPPQPDSSRASNPAGPAWRWLECLANRRRALQALLVTTLFAVALLLCYRLLLEINLDAVRQALLGVPASRVVAALGLTLLSYLLLLGYEWSAARYAGARLAAKELALGGFAAFAIGNTVGLAMLSGGSVRYRLYARQGLGSLQIAQMTLFTSLALALTLPLLAALATLVDLPAASVVLALSCSVLVSLAVAVLLVYGLLLVLAVCSRIPGASTADTLQCQLWGYSIRLPGWRLALLQFLISTLDVLAAAGVLYLLLPQGPPFGVFLLVYLLALAAGVLSHVPGGVGVFEAVLLGAFAGRLDGAQLAAALLLYRSIYLLLPFALACLLLLFNEARRWLPAGAGERLTAGLVTPVLALLVFVSGVALVFSGATPAMDTRLHALGFLVPKEIVSLSHLGASLIGVICLLLAQGLLRRLSAAWAMTLVLLTLGAIFSLLKGLDWEEASLLALTGLLLMIFRRSFYRTSRLLEVPFSPLTLVASVCVLGASLWLMKFVYKDVPYDNLLWWQFALDADAPRSLRAALGSALLLFALALGWLLRAAPPEIRRPDAAQLKRALAIVKASDQPDAGLVMTGDKALLFHDKEEAFLMYSRHGRSLIALFDPVGEPRARADLVWQFRDLCDRHRARPVFYQVRAQNLPLYMDVGLTALKLGEEARVDLTAFDLASKGKKDLRYTWNRGQRDGLAIDFYAPGQAPLDELKPVSDAWLTAKQVREKGFSLGRFDADYLGYFPMAVVRFQGRAVAFASLLETDRGELASLDLMRVLPDAPKLTMEFFMLGLILHYQQRGLAWFSLGMVPLAGLHPRRGAPLAQRLGAMVYRAGEQFYNFQGLRRFKDKFDPQWEPRYMAVPAGLDPLVAFADTAALIAGGYSGLVRR